MKNGTSLEQRFRHMNYLMVGMSSLILIGYITSFKMVINAKEGFHQAVAQMVQLDEAAVDIRDVTIGLQTVISNTHEASTHEKLPFEKAKQSLKQIRRTLGEVISSTPSEALLGILTNATNNLDEKLVPALDRWHERYLANPKKSEEFYLTQYVPIRTELDDLITGAKTKVLLEARHYGDRQSLYVRLASVIMGILIIISATSSLFFFRRLSVTVIEILANLAEQLSGSILKVQGACKNIDSASRQVAESATEHASAIEETAASMEEMTAMVAQASMNANNSLNVTRESQKQVEKGKEIISQMNIAMQQIQMANTKLGAILQIIGDIKNKTKIINDIVFETRLLSFNASIEAARAGIHGKGFAVVAEEVGKLASISGKSADEIRSLLDSSVSEVNQIIGTTHEKVSSAKTVSEQCEGAFYSMAEAMRKIADAMDGITTAAGQQEQGIRETNKAMMDISHVTQKNSASAERMLAQVFSLGDLVGSLTGLVVNLREFLYGKNANALKVSENEKRYQNSLPVASNEIVGKHTFQTVAGDGDGDSSSESESQNITRSDSRWKNVS